MSSAGGWSAGPWPRTSGPGGCSTASTWLALALRRPEGVIYYSDQGSQDTSIAFGQSCAKAGVRPSMGSVGDCYVNATCESFFATPKCELIERHSFRTQAEAKAAVFDFIEGRYNPRRQHSALGYLPPINYERTH